MSFTAMWGDSATVTYSSTARNHAQTYVPPAIPMMTMGSPSPVENGTRVTKVIISLFF